MKIERAYITSNGRKFSDKENAELAQEILDLKKQKSEISIKLENLKKTCQHTEKRKEGGHSVDIKTVTNDFGEECGEVCTVQAYICNICHTGLIHYVEDDEWFAW